MSVEIARTKKPNKTVTPPFCACGCGGFVDESKSKKGTWNKFIHGHNGRGIPRPEHVRSKISKSHVGIGKGMSRSPATEFKKGERRSIATEFKNGDKMRLGKSVSQEVKEKLSLFYRQQRKTKPCDYCSKEIEITPHALQHKKHHFCGRKCSSSYFSGNRSNRWKGGITPENQAIRRSTEYREWIHAVFRRDNYTCYLCSQKGVKLHAHHLMEFSKFPSRRLDLENGLTLCSECHMWCHSENIDPIVYKVSKWMGII